MDIIFLVCRYLNAEAIVLSSTSPAREVWAHLGFRPCARTRQQPQRLEVLYYAAFGHSSASLFLHFERDDGLSSPMVGHILS
jgi:hypothetical protein